MKAVRIQAYNKPLVLRGRAIPAIEPAESKFGRCGMCRSDMQLVDGYFAIPRHSDTHHSGA